MAARNALRPNWRVEAIKDGVDNCYKKGDKFTVYYLLKIGTVDSFVPIGARLPEFVGGFRCANFRRVKVTARRCFKLKGGFCV